MNTTRGLRVQSASSNSSTSTSTDSALLSATWPDLFATDRQLPQATQPTTQFSTALAQENDAQDDSSVYGDDEDIEKGSYEDMIDNYIDTEMANADLELFFDFDMAERSPPFLVAEKVPRSSTDGTQKARDSPSLSLRPDDRLSKTGHRFAHVQSTKNQELDRVDKASSSTSGLSSISNVSALNPENDTPVRNPVFKQKAVNKASSSSSTLSSVSNVTALNPDHHVPGTSPLKRKVDDADLDMATKQSKRAKLAEPFAYLKRNEENSFVHAARKKEGVLRWLDSVEPQDLP